MNIQIVILFIINFIELILGLYLLLSNPKNEIRRTFSFFVFCVVLWGVTNALLILTNALEKSFIWAKLTYFFAGLFVVIFTYFSMIFPYRNTLINLWKKIVLILPTLVISILLFFTKLLIEKPIYHYGINDVILGSYYFLYILFFLGFWLWGLVNLIKKYKVSDGIHRWQLRYVLWGIIISSVTGMITNLILPAFGLVQYGLYGPIASIFWLGFTSYIVWKKY